MVVLLCNGVRSNRRLLVVSCNVRRCSLNNDSVFLLCHIYCIVLLLSFSWEYPPYIISYVSNRPWSFARERNRRQQYIPACICATAIRSRQYGHCRNSGNRVTLCPQPLRAVSWGQYKALLWAQTLPVVVGLSKLSQYATGLEHRGFLVLRLQNITFYFVYRVLR